jgi:hypothetical protein
VDGITVVGVPEIFPVTVLKFKPVERDKDGLTLYVATSLPVFVGLMVAIVPLINTFGDV